MNDVSSGKDHPWRSPAFREAMVMQRRQAGLTDPDNSSLPEVRRQRNELSLDSLLGEKGVQSRVAFVRGLKAVAKRIQGGNVGDVVGFIVIGGDIRNLKFVNDAKNREGEREGSHQVGDAVIVNAGAALSDVVRPGLRDKVARVGGDEFLALLPITKAGFDKEMARVLMEEGSEDDIGRLQAIEEGVEKGLVDIRDKHGYLSRASEAGKLDIGWDYIDKGNFIRMSEAAKELDPKEGDFVTLLQARVEEGVTGKKDGGDGQWGAVEIVE